MTDSDEAPLLLRVPTGDERAFEQLYALYETRLRLVAWRICKRPDVADDLANETWCRAFNSRTSYDPARSFINWLGGILQNVWREHARATVRENPTGNEIRHNSPMNESDEIAPETAIDQAEMLAGLNDCLERLGSAERDLIRWRFFDGQSLRHVAQRLGIAEATLREHRLPAAMAKIERCLKQKGLDHFLAIPGAQSGGGLQYRVGDDE